MGVRRRGEKAERKTAPKYSEKKLDRSTRAQVGPIEGQYSGHARELVNRFIARLVDRSIGRSVKREVGEKGGRRDLQTGAETRVDSTLVVGSLRGIAIF